jgi:beta-lactam-binding protein with PASTA domain
MRYGRLCFLVLATAFLVTGCGGESNRVPDLEGDRLDVAQRRLDDAGLDYELTGGAPRRNRSSWRVCDQRPAPGKRAESVELLVARSCGGVPPLATVPYVVGLSLDEAKHELAERGIDYYVDDEGTGEVVVDSAWTVCDQWPYSGEGSETVELSVEHICDDEEEDDDDDF